MASIVTKKGDQGTTSLLYGRKVSKTEDRVEAYGTIDELGSAIGFAKALARESSQHTSFVEVFETIQSQLLCVGADLATSPEDHARKNKPQFKDSFLDWIDNEVSQVEPYIKLEGFVLPGANPLSGAIHVARTVSRRAERRTLAILTDDSDEPFVRRMLPYLNRLSDLLWLIGERTAQ